MSDKPPSVTDILRFYGMYERYEGSHISGETQVMAKLRGSRVDKAAELMAMGAKKGLAHCAAHLMEKATRRDDASITVDLRAAMKEEAENIAFGRVSDDGWAERNVNCPCMGFLKGVERFYKEHPSTLIEAQFTVINQTLNYQGHPDHLIQTDKGYTLLSIKTGTMPNFAGVQEALYLLAKPETFEWPVHHFNIRRAVVQFKADGTYCYSPLNDHRDFVVAERFAAAYWDARKLNGETD